VPFPRRFKFAAAAILLAAPAHAAPAAALLADGDAITPEAVPDATFTPLTPNLPGFPNVTAGQAVSTAISPDGQTLAVLTSGYNRLEDAAGNDIPAASNEYVFIYNISAGAPLLRQVIVLPNTYAGIVFGPDDHSLYVSGGVDDDVHAIVRTGAIWSPAGAPIALGHKPDAKNPFNQGGVGIDTPPETAGLAVTADGKTLIAANFTNDRLSVITLATGAITEVPLRPGLINPADTGKPGGEYPFAVAIAGNATAYVGSARDREIDVVDLTGTPSLTTRIKLPGTPLKMILNKSATRLYVATDNADAVEMIDTAADKLIGAIPVLAPPDLLKLSQQYRGASPDSLALSPDEKTLYVTDGGTNALAVIDLTASPPAVTGLIPTGAWPTAVSISKDGTYFYVVNAAGPAGPNPGNCATNAYSAARYAVCAGANQYILQLTKAGLLSGPMPTGAALDAATAQVANNDHFAAAPSKTDTAMMAFLHAHIRHIVYIIRENRSYDQVLGDLGEGDGDASLTEFGAAVTPNAHALAQQFVDLDHFMAAGDIAGEGWAWSTAARAAAFDMLDFPITAAGRGLTDDRDGMNRNIDTAIPTAAGRALAFPAYPHILPDAPDALPGTANLTAPDSPDGDPGRGYLWDAALRAGLTVRDYGFALDLTRATLPVAQGGIPEIEDPYAAQTQVAFPADAALAPFTDIYFRGFDNKFPDFDREAEWAREFAAQIRNDDMPNLTLLRLMHDHLGAFSSAIDGLNTPDAQMADNDYALGKVIDAVAHSPYAASTLIFVVEDDAQDGPDHIGAHRSLAFVIGPYVKQHAVIATPYSTVNILSTIEDILGIDHLSIHDALQPPMTDLFDPKHPAWTYHALTPATLAATTLPVSP
jgi:DNA-binding beta-propeller fold protein YncE